VTEIACSKLGCRATTTFTITNADLDDETPYDAQFGDDGWTTVNSPNDTRVEFRCPRHEE